MRPSCANTRSSEVPDKWMGAPTFRYRSVTNVILGLVEPIRVSTGSELPTRTDET
jgi:hypothetical protein